MCEASIASCAALGGLGGGSADSCTIALQRRPTNSAIDPKSRPAGAGRA
jgi:hypothetical protein